jgi:DNA-binding LytR/AlgR family response regulator
MRILAAEDDKLFATAIEMMIDELGYELIAIEDEGGAFLRTFVATQPDLLLLDINIKGSMDGIEIAEKINASNRPVPIIFITSFKDKQTFERAKLTKPFAYITKPFDEMTLQRTIELALHNYSNNTNLTEIESWTKDLLLRDSFFIKTAEKLEKIVMKDILYLEVAEKYTHIVTENKKWEVKMSLTELLEKLSFESFIKIHRNYIVNVNYIQSIDIVKNTLQVQAYQLPYSTRYGKALIDRLNKIL